MESEKEIDQTIASLRERLAELCESLPRERVIAAFTEETEGFAQQLPPELQPYAYRRVNCLLADAGLIAAEDEAEPCPPGEPEDASS